MGNYDLSLRLTEAEIEILDRVDMVVEQSMTSGNPNVAFRYGQQLRMARHLSGIGLAKLLYMMRERWEHFASDDDFQTVAETEMGVPQDTYKKYTEVWENVIENAYVASDEALQLILLGKPIEGLIRLRAGARDGDFNKKHWEQLARATTVGDMIDVVRDARGLQTSASKTWRWLVAKGGKVMGRQGEGNYEEVAFIKRDGTDAQLAFEHMLEKCGVYVEPVK
jgi:hypothetical protein